MKKENKDLIILEKVCFVEVMRVNAIRATLARNNFQLSSTATHDIRDLTLTRHVF